MKTKDVIKIALAGLGTGAIIGIGVCLDIYDFGYQTRVREENGDNAAKALNLSLQEIRTLTKSSKPKKN